MKKLSQYIVESNYIRSLNTYIIEADDFDLGGSGDDDKDENDDTADDDETNKPQDVDDSNDDDEKKDEDEEKTTKRGNIKFTIWKEPKKKVNWLEDNDYNYQKIEYQYRSEDKKVEIDFLLGYVESEKTWKLWIGKIGRTTYDDDPWCDLKEKKFAHAIVAALDKVEDFMKDVEKDNPENWIQFYKDV